MGNLVKTFYPPMTLSVPLPRIGARSFGIYAGFVVLLAMLFGGSGQSGLWSNVIVQLAALPLLGWALYRLMTDQVQPGRPGIYILLAIVALPLFQLIPMPPLLWSEIPGRKEIVSVYEVAGMLLPWLPISFDPAATWRSLLSLIPAAAIFLAMLSLNKKERVVIIGIILVVVIASIPLDLLQLMGGEDSPLRFFAITVATRAVGFFANSNHNAALLYCAIPFAAALAIGFARDYHRRWLGVAFVSGFLIAIMVGLAVTYSRAGMALGFIAGLSCLALAWRLTPEKSRRTILLIGVGANLLAVLIAFQFGFVALSQRAEEQGLTDLRWPVAAVTLQAASSNLPLGTGFGTFVPVYEMFAPPKILGQSYVNHAHDDWLELSLEGGVPGLVVVFLFLCWFTIAGIRIWRNQNAGEEALDRALARASSIAIILLLVHSALDYPLRTPTIMTLFAVSCALMFHAAWRKPAGS